MDLNLDDFEYFYNLVYSIVALLEHVIAKHLDLLHFLDSWVVYGKKKGIYHWLGCSIVHQVTRS